MRDYELMVLVSDGAQTQENSGSKESREAKVLEDLKKTISQVNGTVTATDEWGMRPLAYPIDKKTEAVYYLLEVSLPEEGVLSVSKMLQVHDNIIRYLLLKKESKKQAVVPKLKTEGEPKSQAKPAKEKKETRAKRETKSTKKTRGGEK